MTAVKHDYDPLWIALTMLPIGALAGLAALLRSNEEITTRALVGAALNSSLFCAAVCAVMFWHFGDEAILLNIAVSVLAGLGGNTTLGAVIRVAQIIAEKYVEGSKHDK